ncbi:hypothetical protein AYM40_21000 [Paraburkholderia phytofirmans OLGA172]|uniref:Peptidase S8/S53 domain-containing protein n=1 Tax=Paraburkholderia phytofirmans OLGA172 TaxID=1417228 RepID=A0A160FQB4_9BURK|nr:S8/S53 family peptidase [Paraburkholderia phytofirmans]ANB74931.1 hypothetical protein AYM40_21000 [Paraburkholderia phytofirmans OLGA172]
MNKRTVVLLVTISFSPVSGWAQNADTDSIRRHELLIFVKQKGPAIASAQGLDSLASTYDIKPLSPASEAEILSNGEQGRWLIAVPKLPPTADTNPWDDAYTAAETARGPGIASTSSGANDVYIEPNVESKAPTSVQAVGPLPPPWPNGNRFAWHLEDAYSGLATARTQIKKGGCIPRITILDTGIWPQHSSTPRQLQTKLQRNFFDGDKVGIDNATDPGTSTALIKNPMHGTGTIGILAGGKVLASENSDHFQGDLGGAPDALIVPVRISDSVVHFWTKEMAQGIDYAATLPGAGTEQFCDVVSISMGGLPSRKWASAVNKAYSKGIVIVAAAGNNFSNFPTHFTVYPSRFSRVVTVSGAMADYTPYLSPPGADGSMEGNYGPASVMQKAVAAYTPNIPWAKWGTEHEYDLDGAGTSAATPQVAAAFALWLQSHAVQEHIAPGPTRVEASMKAIFESADVAKAGAKTSRTYFGNGLLRADVAMKHSAKGPFKVEEPAQVSFPFWRILFGLNEHSSLSAIDQMRELEALQVSLQSPELAKYTDDQPEVSTLANQLDARSTFIAALKKENISVELRKYLDSHPLKGG